MTDIIVFSIPIALAGLGETVVQRSGVLNIGVEGVMLASAYAATVGSIQFGNAGIGLAVGVGVGLALTLLFGLFTVRWRCDQVVTGTAVNLLALGVTASLFRGRFGESGELLNLPKLPTVAGMDTVVWFGIAALAALAWALNRTSWGLLVRACGEYPVAVTAQGFSVEKLRMQSLAVGGILGGMGGAYLAVGVNGSFAENMTAGRGFVAIALVTFGRWKPGWVFLAALGMGYLETLKFVFQARGVQVPFQLMLALPYVAALLVLLGVGKGAYAPKALGVPYRAER